MEVIARVYKRGGSMLASAVASAQFEKEADEKLSSPLKDKTVS